MTDKDEEILADLLLRWEELRERGQDTPAAELCQEHPHLIEELARRIKAMKAVSWMDKPLGPGDDGPDSEGSTNTKPRTLIGRYRLDDLIATGGFAQVWRGYDLELQRVVAVKVPRPSRLQSADAFMAEARRVARLKHPGIVAVFDVGHDGDACFIVSEFVEGGSLGDHLSRNPPTQQQAIRWIAEIADALEYAHLHGIVHRDIKPANILIDHHGRALLADFGIAQSANKAGQEALSLGTLRYMSPEQLEGREVDPRSDIFSLGVVLHETLTGKLPYSSVEPNVLRREIVAGAKVGTEKLPTELKQICQKALARLPHQRHSSGAHLAIQLRKCLESSPKSTGTVLVVAVVTLAVAFGAVVWWKTQQPIPAAVEQAKAGETPQVEQSATARFVAETILREGGRVIIDERSESLSRLDQLPAQGTISISAIDFPTSKPINTKVLQLLPKLPTFNSLNASGTNFSDADLVHFQGQTLLRTLRLNDTKVTGEGLGHLAGLDTLDFLEVARAPVTDDGLARLPAFPTLTWMNLSWTKITDEGLRRWKKPKGLRTLYLIQLVGVTDAGIDTLSELKELTSLNLVGSGITTAGVEKLQRLLPKCKIDR